MRLLEVTDAEQRVFGEWSMVQVTPSRELARLGAAFEAAECTRVDAMTASAAIQLMRALLLTGTAAQSAERSSLMTLFDERK